MEIHRITTKHLTTYKEIEYLFNNIELNVKEKIEEIDFTN